MMTSNEEEVGGNLLMGPAPPTVYWVPDVELRRENLEDGQDRRQGQMKCFIAWINECRYVNQTILYCLIVNPNSS